MASWINYVADEHTFTAEERCNISEAFDSVTGTQLLSMTKDEFLQADPSKGGLLFDIFKGVFPSGNYTEPKY